MECCWPLKFRLRQQQNKPLSLDTATAAAVERLRWNNNELHLDLFNSHQVCLYLCLLWCFVCSVILLLAVNIHSNVFNNKILRALSGLQSWGIRPGDHQNVWSPGLVEGRWCWWLWATLQLACQARSPETLSSPFFAVGPNLTLELSAGNAVYPWQCRFSHLCEREREKEKGKTASVYHHRVLFCFVCCTYATTRRIVMRNARSGTQSTIMTDMALAKGRFTMKSG